MIAVNPRDPRHLVVSYHQVVLDTNTRVHFGERASVHVAWSRDGGGTWTVAAGTSPTDFRIAVDASAAVDLHGHAFLAYLAFQKLPEASASKTVPGNGMFVRRSLDGGRTWEAMSTPLVEYSSMEPFQDKAYLVADNGAASPHAGNLYVGWTSFSKSKSDVLFARSTDDGKSWSRPMVISAEPGTPTAGDPNAIVGFHAAVGPDGAVYAIWPDGRGIVLAVSHDGGRTFERPRRVVPIRSAPLFFTTTKTGPLFGVSGFPFANGLPSLAVASQGSSGRLVMTWGDTLFGDVDIMVSTSDDGGRTWTEPARVNDDAKHNGKDQVLGWLGVDPSNGAINIVFYDRRSDPRNLLPSVTLARSTDGGRSFTNYRWSDAPSDPRRANLGDYIGVAALDGHVYGAWVDNALRRPGADTPVSPYVPSGPSVIRIGIANFRQR
jgi:hypothetical protein